MRVVPRETINSPVPRIVVSLQIICKELQARTGFLLCGSKVLFASAYSPFLMGVRGILGVKSIMNIATIGDVKNPPVSPFKKGECGL
jgi:hypothetical protein